MKLCIDCKHLKRWRGPVKTPNAVADLYCSGPQYISLITGKQEDFPLPEARYKGDCGREAIYWEACDPTP